MCMFITQSRGNQCLLAWALTVDSPANSVPGGAYRIPYRMRIDATDCGADGNIIKLIHNYRGQWKGTRVFERIRVVVIFVCGTSRATGATGKLSEFPLPHIDRCVSDAARALGTDSTSARGPVEILRANISNRPKPETIYGVKTCE